ncbi:MAG: FKBP-type peptidylprolyl isomerase [Flavobacterium sp.]|nr:FKBP-type peptidylprolyl isomerase [Flavobacterium sp.]
MNKFKFYFILLITTVSLFSCSKNESTPVEPPRLYSEQYKTDLTDIEDYLKNNYITVVNHPGLVDDQDVTIAKIDAGQPSIMSYLDSPTYPKLLIRPVKLQNVDYKLYYLVLRPGVGESPCNVDGVLASYRGDYLSRDATTKVISTTKFEQVIYPQSIFSLYTVITGWSEIFPQFKTGDAVVKDDGTVTYSNFGAGVMFIPSGLGYYNNGSGAIPAYAPLVFSFKLYDIQRLDQDNDGIFSYQEDLKNKDGYMYDYRNTFNYPTAPDDLIKYADDTDQDGIPDFLDVDDDGDNYTTKLEITKPAGTNSGLSLYFPYDPIVDNPLTTVIETETKGVPEYSAAGTPDYTTATRKRIYLDKEHHTAKP